MVMNKKVLIREVGVREGFQTISKIVPTQDKILLINALSATGVEEIEVASFVRSDRVPQMADAEDLVKQLAIKQGVSYLGLYLNRQGFERAQATGKLNNRGWIYTAASDLFLKQNSNTSIRGVEESIPQWADLFKQHQVAFYGVMISAAFGYQGALQLDTSHILELIKGLSRRIHEHGGVIQEIALADTVGLAVPDQVRRFVGTIAAEYPAIRISLHLHDTRGAGLANAYAGYLEGVRIFESSVGGLGGCPFAAGASGNIVSEDLIALLEGQGVSTGINLSKYIEAARLAEQVTGLHLPSKMLRAKL